MNRTPATLFALALALAACGDDPRPSGPVVEGNNSVNNGGTSNNGDSNNGVTNNGVATNNGVNNGATNNGDLPSGEVCELVDTTPFRGMCDVVRDEGCDAGKTCLVALILNGPEVDVTSWCDETDRHTLPEDAPCNGTEQRCAPGLFCIDFLGTCQKLCYFDGGVGCDPDEWCNQADAQWKGVGYCNDQCDPLE